MTEIAFRKPNIVFPYGTPGLDVGMTLLSADNLRHGSVWNWFMPNPEPQKAMWLAGIQRVEAE